MMRGLTRGIGALRFDLSAFSHDSGAFPGCTHACDGGGTVGFTTAAGRGASEAGGSALWDCFASPILGMLARDLGWYS